MPLAGLITMTTSVLPHSAISPTAKLVAYLRSLTDIPYSRAISLACDAEAAFAEIVGDDPRSFSWLAPMLELRYRSIDRLMTLHGSSRIVELAAGLSPRGLIATNDPSIQVLETDLPGIISEKSGIALVLFAASGAARQNLRWMPVNATSRHDFQQIDEYFPEGPVTVISEGLFPYLSHDEKRAVGFNIRKLLRDRKGVWITPDLSSCDRIRRLLEIDPDVGRVVRAVSGHVGRDLLTNSFLTDDAAQACFGGMGFSMERFRQSDLVGNLSSLGRIEVDRKKVDVLMSHGSVWVLRDGRS
jgi:Leucine carboxyl methyltransferase